MTKEPTDDTTKPKTAPPETPPEPPQGAPQPPEAPTTPPDGPPGASGGPDAPPAPDAPRRKGKKRAPKLRAADAVGGPFPAHVLAAGGAIRRAAWAPGYALVAADAGGRGGQVQRLMTTGARAGLVEWKPPHLADELLAEDWFMVPLGEVAQ